LGRHSKPSRIRLPQAAPSAAAAATLASVAAASLLSQQVPALASAAPAAPVAPGTPHSARLDAAYSPGLTTAQLVSAIRQAAVGRMERAGKAAPASAAQPATYTVRTGDSLSAIAGRVYQNPNAWPVLYWANHGQIQWADDIQTGQVLRVPAKPATIPAPPTQLAPPAPRHASTAAVVAQSAAPAPAAAPVPAPAAEPTGTLSGPWPGGAFGNCVVERESGGNPQVMNASGHYGLYQFSFSTWVAYGGNPADFGNASVAEQEQVFLNAMATPGGANNWAPYDGC
jgi:LysM repeat protein